MRKLLGDFVSVVRELSLDELRDAAALAPSVLIMGERSARERVARQLFGDEGMSYVTLADGMPSGDAVARADAAILVWSSTDAIGLTQAAAAARARGWPVLVASLGSALPAGLAAPGETLFLPAGPDADWESVRARLVDQIEETRLPALGRYLPVLRPAVARSLVETTARANGQFAALSSLPALLPFVGNLVGAAGDFLVLTKNQLLLLYKLAAVYGRDIDQRRQIYVEMAPVVGAGLVWRTIARELVALVPGFLGAVPKIAIAYTGTYVVGRAAQYYYQEGRVPNADEWRSFYRQALNWLETVRQGMKQQPAPPAPPAPPQVRVLPVEGRERPVVH